MNKFVRVMDGLKSNACGFHYKLDEINISEHWDTSTLDPEKMGGFNFGTEDKILRWLHRGDTIYDVIVPEDAEVILCDEEKGIYRSNKIIVTNPRPITDDMVMELYKKTTLSDKIIAQCLVTLLWKKRNEISKYIIKDRVNLNNINEILEEFVRYAGEDNLYSETVKELYDILKEIQSPLEISLYISKEPYEKIISEHKIINLTGQSGSGKSTYARKYFNSDEYVIIDTDEVFSENRYLNSTGLNKELGTMFREKYQKLPNLGTDFDLIYKEILNYCKNITKTIVIDCAQFHCIKDISILKGKIIIIRTDIDTCYKRCIERFKKNNPNVTEEEIQKYSEKKKSLYKWYKNSNEFIKRIDEMKICKEYLNLYDKDGNLVNKKGIRGEKTEYLKGIVMIFIENGNGEFLIQKTSNSRNSIFATTGGHVTYGSTFKESIIKEVKEELGVDISNEKIIEVYTYIWGYYLQKVYYLKKDIDINNINIQEDEVEYVKWIDKKTINKLIENKEFREGNIEGYQYIINNYK